MLGGIPRPLAAGSVIVLFYHGNKYSFKEKKLNTNNTHNGCVSILHL